MLPSLSRFYPFYFCCRRLLLHLFWLRFECYTLLFRWWRRKLFLFLFWLLSFTLVSVVSDFFLVFTFDQFWSLSSCCRKFWHELFHFFFFVFDWRWFLKRNFSFLPFPLFYFFFHPYSLAFLFRLARSFFLIFYPFFLQHAQKNTHKQTHTHVRYLKIKRSKPSSVKTRLKILPPLRPLTGTVSVYRWRSRVTKTSMPTCSATKGCGLAAPDKSSNLGIHLETNNLMFFFVYFLLCALQKFLCKFICMGTLKYLKEFPVANVSLQLVFRPSFLSVVC